MTSPGNRALLVGGGLLLLLAASVPTQERLDVFVAPRDHPAINYSSGPVSNVVDTLNERIRSGALHLTFEQGTGYLAATLGALRVPVESQTLVFSQTSAQADEISITNPRALYFTDDVAVGWVRGARVLELAAHDRRQGVVFYTLEQQESAAPRFRRDDSCLLCHQTWETLNVPGLQVLSTFPMSDDPRAYASGLVMDHRTPYAQRWSGWFVTRRTGSLPHLGNLPVIVPARELEAGRRPTVQLESVRGRFDASGYPTECSDIIALSVLAHQTHATNLITRLGWEARVAAFEARQRGTDASPAESPRVTGAARDLSEYLLFVDEAPLTSPLDGGCRFAEAFALRAVRDSKGRSLRDFDLRRRLFRYPLSYMVESAAFVALDSQVKDLVYRYIAELLGASAWPERFGKVEVSDRRAALEILRETGEDLPAWMTAAAAR